MRQPPIDIVNDHGHLSPREIQRAADVAAGVARTFISGAFVQTQEGTASFPGADIPDQSLPVIITPPPPPPPPPPVYIEYNITLNQWFLVVTVNNLTQYFLIIKIGHDPYIPKPDLYCFTDLVRVCPVKDADGFVTGLVNMVRDVCVPKALVTVGAPYCVTDPDSCCATGSGAPPGDCVTVVCCDAPVSPTLTLLDGASGASADLLYVAGYLGFPAPGVWLGLLDGTPALLYCDPGAGWVLVWGAVGGEGTASIEAESVVCSPTLALAFGVPGQASGVGACSGCSGPTPPSWAGEVAGASGCFGALSGPWALSHHGPCSWEVVRADGATGALTASGGVLSLELSNPSDPARPSASYRLIGWPGDCCAPATLALVASGCASAGAMPAALTLTPDCGAERRTLTVTGPACTATPPAGVVTSCCGESIPQSLVARVDDTVNVVFATLTWNASLSRWCGDAALASPGCTGEVLSLQLECVQHPFTGVWGFLIYTGCSGQGGAFNNTQHNELACSPFRATFSGASALGTGCDGCGPWNITVSAVS